MENINYNFEGGSSKQECEEDLCKAEHPTPVSLSNQGPRQVLTRGITALQRCSVPVLSLALLATVLLMVDIGLGVHYQDLKETHLTLDDTERLGDELTKLHDSYKDSIKSMNDYKKALDNELRLQTTAKWELEHETKRTTEYEARIAKMKADIAALKEELPKNVTGRGCRPCPKGWLWVNSMCYLFPFPDFYGSKTWSKARKFCQAYGGDLAIIDTKVKESKFVRYLRDNVKPNVQRRFWIGLRNSEEREIWKWIDGRILAEGYWQEGEPSDTDEEACVAVEAKENFFQAWNDYRCDNSRHKWICERAETEES